MIKNITLGQYFPGNSVIHKLDPRVKIIIALALIVIIFILKSVIGYGVLTALLITVILVSRVSFRVILKGIRPLWFIILFTVVLNAFFYNGKTIIFQWEFLKLTWEGIQQAILIAVRLIYLIAFTSLLTLTTSPMEITDALEQLLKPLKVIKFPAHELAMMMSIAMRFIPTLLEETDKIMKAQTARGAEFDSGNILAKAKNMVPLLVPLFVSAFKRADELALAMESRCYRGGNNRTRMKVLHMAKRDYVAFGIMAAFIAFTCLEYTIMMEIFGSMSII